jgi:hypothetical protein
MPRTLNKTDFRKGIGNGKLVELRFDTLNIGTFFKAGAIKIIIDEIKRYKMLLVALQEIRWPGNGSVKSDYVTILYSKGTSSRHKLGIGFLINESLLPEVIRFEVING